MTGRTTVEMLRSRAEKFMALRDVLRIGGIVVRSPVLCDGTVEVHVNGHAYFLSTEPIDQLNARFGDEIGGPVNDLPVTEGRMPLSDEEFAEYCAFVGQRRHS